MELTVEPLLPDDERQMIWHSLQTLTNDKGSTLAPSQPEPTEATSPISPSPDTSTSQPPSPAGPDAPQTTVRLRMRMTRQQLYASFSAIGVKLHTSVHHPITARVHQSITPRIHHTFTATVPHE